MNNSQNPNRYTITAALPYTNGPVHIGHLAGVYLPADIYSRYLRLMGNDVLYICGSDEHGVPITIKAKKEGITPQQVVDKYHVLIKDTFDSFGISFDNYSRTTAKIHHDTATDFFLKLNDSNQFLKEVTSQLYDASANQFLADRFVVGTCPKCGSEESYGDQCESCGTSHNATDLINPKSTITGNVPVLKETQHWFLPLDKHEKWLREWVLVNHKKDWKTNVLGQVKSWLDDGLRPRAVTRDLDWGIPVPVEGGKGKVLYVWFDAPIGYISSTKEWAQKKGVDWEPYWKDKSTKLVHFIGKDNIVFHCVIFPAMLKAEGSYILPENVPANEFLNLEGNKISTSKNWAVWLHEYLVDFPEKQDVLRYVLTANAPESKDNDFTWLDFQARNNNELAAIYGNFINRVLVLTHKYYDGIVPQQNDLLAVDIDALSKMKAFPMRISKSIELYRFREALGEFMNLARLGNKYLADQEPWKLIKTDPKRVQTILNVGVQIAASLAILSEPFLPFSSKKLKAMLNLDPALSWNDVTNNQNLVSDNHQINPAEILFPQIEDAEVQKQVDRLAKIKIKNENQDKEIAAVKKSVSFEDFTKLDIRVGTIIEAEKVPKTKKLLQLKVDLGFEIRTVVSGIAESFSCEEVLGKKVSVLVNLEPRKIRGVESKGMILMTDTSDGKLAFMIPSKQDVDNGSVIS